MLIGTRAAEIQTPLETLLRAHPADSTVVEDVNSLRRGLRAILKSTNLWKSARSPGAALLRKAFKPLLPLMGLDGPGTDFSRRNLKTLENFTEGAEGQTLTASLEGMAFWRLGPASRSPWTELPGAVAVSDGGGRGGHGGGHPGRCSLGASRRG